MKIGLKYKQKKFDVNVKQCRGLRIGFGLMFRTKNTSSLLFDTRRFKNMSLTSLFVFFPFVALWVDDKNQIVDKKVIKPFTMMVDTKKSFSKIIEIPINDKNKKIMGLLDED